jgi:hypothetical protein
MGTSMEALDFIEHTQRLATTASCWARLSALHLEALRSAVQVERAHKLLRQFTQSGAHAAAGPWLIAARAPGWDGAPEPCQECLGAMVALQQVMDGLCISIEKMTEAMRPLLAQMCEDRVVIYREATQTDVLLARLPLEIDHAEAMLAHLRGRLAVLVQRMDRIGRAR